MPQGLLIKDPITPRRSVLYMPGINARALEKARSLEADAFIFDLEDAVAPDQKETARQQVLDALNEGGYQPHEVIVRVNGLETPWSAEDIAALASLPAGRFNGLLLPKAESSQQVTEALDAIDTHGGHHLALWLMIETPWGLLRIEEIATASERIACLVMGTSDLANELRVPPTPERTGFLYALSRCVLVSRATGCDILDGVYLSLNDSEGFKQACQQGVELGFDGKTLIHPQQLAAANAIFSPSSAEVDYAKKVVSAWEDALAQGQGVVVVNERLVENLHYAEALRTLRTSEAINPRLPPVNRD